MKKVALEINIAQTKPMRLHGSFTCTAGELTALVGPSGSGKTSLLRVMAGLLVPQEGTLTVNQQTWLDTNQKICISPQKRKVGMVFQQYALMPHLHALGNVMLALGHLPLGQRKKVAMGWLVKMGLTKAQVLRRPNELSGGQQQRVALARALSREPQLLLLDEPFSAVDQINRQYLYALIAELKRDLNIPIVLVTHDVQEARLLSDQMVIVDQGEILQSGTPASVFAEPRRRRVADLIGVQNRFSGVMTNKSDKPGWADIQWIRNLKPETLAQPAGPIIRIPDKGKVKSGMALNWIIPSDSLVVHEHLPSKKDGLELFETELIGLRDLGEWSLGQFELKVQPSRHFKINLSDASRKTLQVGRTYWIEMDASRVYILPLKREKTNHSGVQ